MKIRINKFIAQHTQASRRKADELIKSGRVKINGSIPNAGDFVDTASDKVTLDSKVLASKEIGFEYVLYNKPAGVLSSVRDDRGRDTVVSKINSKTKLVPAGRLDYMSSGLIILTNDGDFVYKLTHPRYHLPRKYIVRVAEKIKPGQLNTIKEGGITIEDKVTSPTEIKLINDSNFEITLYEGIKRQIRMSCRAVGLTVESLKRTSIGEFSLAGLKYGEFRHATAQELTEIQKIKSL